MWEEEERKSPKSFGRFLKTAVYFSRRIFMFFFIGKIEKFTVFVTPGEKKTKKAYFYEILQKLSKTF